MESIYLNRNLNIHGELNVFGVGQANEKVTFDIGSWAKTLHPEIKAQCDDPNLFILDPELLTETTIGVLVVYKQCKWARTLFAEVLSPPLT